MALLALMVAAATGASATETAFIDEQFTASLGSGADGPVSTVTVGPDGSRLLTGGFTHVSGVASPGVALLGPDGTVDAAFSAALGSGPVGGIDAAAAMPDGRWILAGLLTGFDGTPVKSIVMLKADGSVDTAFLARGGTGLTSNARVKAVAVTPSGDIVLSGVSIYDYDGTPTLTVLRLEPDGSLDKGFAPRAGKGFDPTAGPTALAVDRDGYVIVPGGISLAGIDSSVALMRLGDDGAPDLDFTRRSGSGFSVLPNSIALSSDGSIAVGGHFSIVDGRPTFGVALFHRDGALDDAFMKGIPTRMDEVEGVVADGRGGVIALGAGIRFDGTTQADVARFDRTGHAVRSTTDLFIGARNGRIRTIAADGDGGLLLGGDFTTWRSEPFGRIARVVYEESLPLPQPTSTAPPDEEGNGGQGSSGGQTNTRSQADSGHQASVGGQATTNRPTGQGEPRSQLAATGRGDSLPTMALAASTVLALGGACCLLARSSLRVGRPGRRGGPSA